MATNDNNSCFEHVLDTVLQTTFGRSSRFGFTKYVTGKVQHADGLHSEDDNNNKKPKVLFRVQMNVALRVSDVAELRKTFREEALEAIKGRVKELKEVYKEEIKKVVGIPGVPKTISVKLVEKSVVDSFEFVGNSYMDSGPRSAFYRLECIATL